MNFLAPLLLLGLLLVPVLAGLYLLVQRRRSRYAVRFTNLDLLANLAPSRPAWRRHVPAVMYLGAVAALALALARPTMVMADAARGRDGAPRHRRLRLDAGDRRRPDAPGCRAGRGRVVPRPAAGEVRVGIVAFSAETHRSVPPTTDRRR